MGVKRFLLVPFLGAEEGRRRRSRLASHVALPHLSQRQTHGDGKVDQYDLSKEETAQQFANKTEEDIVQDINSPIHMWVVATLFPLIAGTFGPMASMFNICAIASSWRLIVSADSTEATGTHIPDPAWLVGVNVVSLAIAVVANLSLLGQMTNKIRYNISAPVTILGWYISGLVDIALVAAASQHVPLPDNPNAAYSQAFYYAAFSGAIYFVLGMMLSVTAWGIWFGHYSDEFKLSLSQRSLMLQTILFLAYVLASGAIYSEIEGWDFLDAVYFVIVTLFTIGFGDLVPKTHLGRSLFFPFAVGGILFVGVIIGNIRTLVLESGSVKVSVRMVEKARYKAIKTGKPEEGMFKIRGMKKRTTSAPTEIERREKEFNIMREIQKQAAQNNRMFSLAFSGLAFMILWFIGAVVFWRAESSTGGQYWSYFESLYFTFVAQLTIGYGDFEPQTNSAKPAFVFWALLALPALTVLIGAVGDAVSDFVGWYTTWVGKHSQNLFSLWESLRHGSHLLEEHRKKKEAEKAKEEADDLGFAEIANLERCRTVPRDFPDSSMSKLQLEIAEETYRPFIMLKAAQAILDHLDTDEPTKYSYREWTWLLKLLGEDEHAEEQHRHVGVDLPPDVEVGGPVRTHQRQVWSWLGQESPLMDMAEGSEPKWVLKRLMQLLEKDLKVRADKRVDRNIERGRSDSMVSGPPPDSSGAEKENWDDDETPRREEQEDEISSGSS